MANNIISKIGGKFLNDPSAIYKLTPNASTYTAQISDPTSTYSKTIIIPLPSDVMFDSSDGSVYSQKGHIHGVNTSGMVSTVSAGTPTGTVSTPSITANNTNPSISRLTSISGTLTATSTMSGGILSSWSYNAANESLTFNRNSLTVTMTNTAASMTVVTDAAPAMSSNPIFYGNALAAHTHSFNVNGYATGEAIKANNKLIYLSSSGVIAPYDTTVFGASIVSNTCENGVGTILFDNDVTSIGNNAFYSRSALKGIIIPDTVTSFGNNAFSGCTSLSSVNIPNNVTSLGTGAFQNCSSLPGIIIPDAMTSIGDSAFSGCVSLSSVNIPSSVSTIGDSTFAGCTSLPVEDGIRYADTYLIEAISKTLSEYTIKSTTRFIGISAFQNCTSMSEINIPATVVRIGASAFSGCTGLNNITSLNPTPPTIQSNTFNNVPATCPIYVLPASVNTYKAAANWSARAAYIQAKTYEYVDYIQTDGYAYINSTISAATDMSMKGKFYLTNINDNFIVSARDGDNRFYLLNANNSAGLVCAKVNWSGSGACQSRSLAWNQWVEVESSVTTTGSTLKFNSINMSSSLSGSLSIPRNIYVLGGDNKGTPSVAPNGCRCSYIKLYKNNALVFDGVAVKRLSDNKYGLLNSVDGQFYGNANSSGSFTGGYFA